MARLVGFLFKITFLVTIFLVASFGMFGSFIIQFSLQRALNHFGDFNKIKIGTVRWSIADPLKLGVVSLNYENDPLSINTKSIQLNWGIDFDKSTYLLVPRFSLTVDSPKITYKLTNSADKLENQNDELKNSETSYFSDLNSLISQFKVIRDFKSHIQINSASLILVKPDKTKLEATQLFVDFNLSSVVNPIVWSIRTGLKIPNGEFDTLPILANGKVALKNGRLDLDNTFISVLEVPTIVNASLSLNDHTFFVKTTTQINDLSKIPIKSKALPITKWQGKLVIETNVFKKDQKSEPEGTLNFQLFGGVFALNYNTSEKVITGVARADVTGSIPFKGMQLGTSELKWNVDLTETEILVKTILKKINGIELRTNGNLEYNNALTIKEAQIKFHNLLARLTGKIYSDQSSQIDFAVQPTDLRGMEKIFLPFSQMPLVGKLELSGRVSGNLNNPMAMNIRIDVLKAKDVSGYISYVNEKMSVIGALGLNIDAALTMENQHLQYGKLNASLRATDLDIQYQDLYRKNKGAQLQFNIEAQKSEEKLSIKAAKITTTAGVIALVGAVPLPPYFDMDMQTNIENWNLGAMKVSLPRFATLIPDGVVKSRLNLSGRINIDEPLKSNIITSGEIGVRLPKYEISASDSIKGKLDEDGKAKFPASFLPNTELVKNLNVHLLFDLETLKWKDLDVKQIQVNGRIDKSKFEGHAKIREVFAGQVTANRLQVPLTSEDPFIQFELSTQGVDVAKGLSTFLPQWNGLVTGKANIKMVGGSHLPASPNFYQKLRADGVFQFSEGVLSSLPVLQMVQERMQQFSGIKERVSAIKSTDLRMKMSSKFLLENQLVQLNNFELLDSKQNLILVNGKMDFNLNLELKGKVAFLQSPIGGSFFEANKDSENRLVVPINITGNAKSPNLHTFDDTLKLMIANTVEYEKKRAFRDLASGVSRNTEQLRKEAEGQLDLQKQKIEDEMRKRLQGLIK